MLFKNIREDIIKKKTFSQVAKYITNRKTINNVSEYLKEINCSHLNAKIILSSYMIRYQNENVLADTELDDEILLRSIELHKILESDTSNNIKRNKIESYVFLYDKWKQDTSTKFYFQ